MKNLMTPPGFDRLASCDSRGRMILEFIDECAAKLTALEGVVGLAVADLATLMGYYRHDREQLRLELTNPSERFELLAQASEQLYKLGKQIDAFIKTTMWLERRQQQMEAARNKKWMENGHAGHERGKGVSTIAK